MFLKNKIICAKVRTSAFFRSYILPLFDYTVMSYLR